MRIHNGSTLFALTAIALAAGCKKTDNSTVNYINAINAYYASRPECLWTEPLKLPVQADTSNTAKTSGYDALVDQGLLLRTTAEKKVFIIASKQVTNYDLSENGRKAWTASVDQPGYGNFCFGTRTVSGVDASSPTTDQPGSSTTVTYHSTLSSVPAWASAAETQSAFPRLQSELAGPLTSTATLKNTTSGWVVATAPEPRAGSASGGSNASGADGSIVR